MKRFVTGLVFLAGLGCVQLPEGAGPISQEKAGALAPRRQEWTAELITQANAHEIAEKEWDVIDREMIELENSKNKKP